MNEGPEIAFISDSGYIYHNSIVNLGSELKIGINASQNPETGKDIIRVMLCRDNGNITVFDTTMYDPEFTYSWDLTAQEEDGIETFVITAWDKGREQTTKKLVISTKDLDPVIMLNDSAGYIWSDTTLGTNDTFYINVLAYSNLISYAQLQNIYITREFDSVITIIADTSTESTAFCHTYELIANPLGGDEVFMFKVTDTRGETGEEEIVVTTLY